MPAQLQSIIDRMQELVNIYSDAHHSAQLCDEYMSTADILFTTVGSCHHRTVARSCSGVSVLVVDNAASVSEPELLLPLSLRPQSVMLFGDLSQPPLHCQDDLTADGRIHSLIHRLLAPAMAPTKPAAAAGRWTNRQPQPLHHNDRCTLSAIPSNYNAEDGSYCLLNVPKRPSSVLSQNSQLQRSYEEFVTQSQGSALPQPMQQTAQTEQRQQLRHEHSATANQQSFRPQRLAETPAPVVKCKFTKENVVSPVVEYKNMREIAVSRTSEQQLWYSSHSGGHQDLSEEAGQGDIGLKKQKMDYTSYYRVMREE